MSFLRLYKGSIFYKGLQFYKDSIFCKRFRAQGLFRVLYSMFRV